MKNKKLITKLLAIIVLFLGIVTTELMSQVEANDFEVNLGDRKLAYWEAMDNNEPETALMHLVVINKKYQELNNWDSVLHYNTKISELALPLGEKEIHLNAYMINMEIEGMFNRKQADLKEKILHIDSFREDPELNAFRKWSIYEKLAQYVYESGFQDSAIFLANRAIIYADEAPEGHIKLAARKKAATLLNGMGRHDEAINHLLWIESSKQFSLEIPYIQCGIYDAMAVAFRGIDDFDKARFYFEKVITLAKENGYTRTLADGYNFLGQLLLDENSSTEARSYLEQSIPLCKEKDMDYEQAECYIYTAATYTLESNHRASNNYLDSAFSMLSTIDSTTLDFIYCRQKIENELAVNNVTAAAKIYEKIKLIPFGTKNKNLIINRLGYRISKAQDRPEAALNYFERFQKSEDSLRQIYDQQQAQRLESEFNRNAQNEQIANLDLERIEQEQVLAQRNRTLLFGLLFSSIVTGLLFFLLRLYRRNRRNNKLLEEQNRIINNALGENKLLLKEIHHRVKNNLQVISSLLSLQERKVDDEQTKEALKSSKSRVETMSILHQSLYQNEEYSYISAPDYFYKLIENLIQTYALTDDLETIVEIEDLKFDVETLIPMGLIANELICNSLKHGIGNRKSGKLMVSLGETESNVILSISDNGGTIGTDFLESNRGSLGVKLIKAFSNRLDAEIEVEKGDHSMVKIVMDKSALRILEIA